MSTFSSWHEVSAPELNQLGVDTYTFTAGYQNLSSATMNREFGLLNLMNTPEHCSAPFHSVSSKVAKSTKMAAAHVQTYVLHVTWSILCTYLIILVYIYILFLGIRLLMTSLFSKRDRRNPSFLINRSIGKGRLQSIQHHPWPMVILVCWGTRFCKSLRLYSSSF